jgi:hypothetical protein
MDNVMRGYEYIPEVGGWAKLPDVNDRPDGPWNSNVAAPQVLRTACAWCPDYDRHDPRNKFTSHTICPSCMNKALADEKKRVAR